MTDSRLDHAFFILGGAAAVWLAFLLVGESFHLGWGQVWFYFFFWAFLAYLLLPRLHRILTTIYVPGYFIGRARTSDGLLGDPVNVALLGDEPQLHAIMRAAGWTQADQVTLKSSRRIISSTIFRRSYSEAPVSPLYLFDRQQDFAYQQEVDNNPGKRHHVRFWRCPEGWLLPGGHKVDWLAAGTYDRSVGFSLFTLQITHKIEQNTDVERDHIISSVTAADPRVTVQVIEDFSTGYHSRNGGGDSISTDGDLPIVDARRVQVPAHQPSRPTDSRDRRPAPTMVGAALVVARSIAAFILALTLVTSSDVFSDITTDGDPLDPQTTTTVVTFVAVVVLIFGLGEVFLAWRIFLGSNGARVIAMGLSSVSVVVQAVDYFTGSTNITLEAGLFGVATDILVLLALSSQRARVYAKRQRVPAVPASVVTRRVPS
ncbi:LssY C-terminal domain-containing protein [Paenarthrobacter sp. TYUT067]|uniref:LssY C-terminal domain-containing protein n=1 Tax=Paenarthrobacter sp. TYUT067 TaxID=2926245 RepID=UPI00202EF0E4|nr:LssY C-terminal domain-containing protein [Paenarthrobacter sp. TYUT067]MCM0616952.1 LssY C-terminal domain-containing protein [Paenarthrobacter sp. TYUT067]